PCARCAHASSRPRPFPDPVLYRSVLHHAFHRFEEETLAGHVGRELVLFVDRQEARGLTFGFLHEAVLVGGRFFANLRCLTAGKGIGSTRLNYSHVTRSCAACWFNE